MYTTYGKGKAISLRTLHARIEEASKVAPIDQFCLSPQCGFASTEEGNILPEEEQWRKLGFIVEVAEDVWGNAQARR